MNLKSVIIIFIIVFILAYLMLIPSEGYERIDVVGSTSVQPLVEKLASDFMKNHSDIKIYVQGGGSGLGIRSVQDGSADIGVISKELKDDEKNNLTEYVLGHEGIVMVVNNNNNVSDLTKDQIKNIYSGNITNWKDVGGSDEEICVVTREEGSGTLSAFKSIIMLDSKIVSDAIVQSSTDAVKSSVEQDPAAVGFISYARMGDDVKTVSCEGVAPSDAAITDGTYDLIRPFILLVNGEASGVVKLFIDFVKSPAGKKIIKENRIIPN